MKAITTESGLTIISEEHRSMMDIIKGMVHAEVEKIARANNPNPHNYPMFEIDGYKFYAINEASAQAQYDKIMRKKNKRK